MLSKGGMCTRIYHHNPRYCVPRLLFAYLGKTNWCVSQTCARKVFQRGDRRYCDKTRTGIGRTRRDEEVNGSLIGQSPCKGRERRRLWLVSFYCTNWHELASLLSLSRWFLTYYTKICFPTLQMLVFCANSVPSIYRSLFYFYFWEPRQYNFIFELPNDVLDILVYPFYAKVRNTVLSL